MKAKRIKEILSTEIKKVASKIRNYCINPDKDFTRNRKLPAEKRVKNKVDFEAYLNKGS